jgi:tetratricopeptide (TPR) repeat protein
MAASADVDESAMQAVADRGHLADEEGNRGLEAARNEDHRSAAIAHARAVEIARSIGDQARVTRWGRTLGVALTRLRLYSRAWTAFADALAAAERAQDERGWFEVAEAWAASYAIAHRQLEAATLLLRAADRAQRRNHKIRLLRAALPHLHVAGEWQLLRDRAEELHARVQLSDGSVDTYALGMVRLAERELDTSQPTPDPADQTTLEVVVIVNMQQAEEMNDVGRMLRMAHLICDVAATLDNPTLDAWKRFFTDPSLPYRVIGDAVAALCLAGRPEESLELSQRIKGLGFRRATLQRLREGDPAMDDARPWLERLKELTTLVEELAEPAREHGIQIANRVRAAGEALLEASAELQRVDPLLDYRLGGIVDPQDLLEAFPLYDPIALIDLVSTRRGFMSHVLVRRRGRVLVHAMATKEDTGETIALLMRIWHESDLAHQFDTDRQEKGLGFIRAILHERLMCGVARHLAEIPAGQLVLIPDIVSRPMPFHLADVCGKEIEVKVAGVNTDNGHFFGDLYPVEYASCLQMAAVSHRSKRPRALRRVVSVADPHHDLPGARSASGRLKHFLPDDVEFVELLGEHATKDRVIAAIANADVIMIGTHGTFDSRDIRNSCLTLHDGSWTLLDIVSGKPFVANPLIILTACEVGATRIGDDVEASGIPGALVAAGAGAVVCNQWPVEDVSMAVITRRLLTHLTHRGYSPAAALFRAIYDLRALGKDEAIAEYRALAEEEKASGAATEDPRDYLLLQQVIRDITRSDLQHPFEPMHYWGGVTVVGVGWHLAAGGFVMSGPETLMHQLDLTMHLKTAERLIEEGRYREALNELREPLELAQGVERARVLDAAAWATFKTSRADWPLAGIAEAETMVAEAERIALVEQDEQILRNVRATRKKLSLWRAS